MRWPSNEDDCSPTARRARVRGSSAEPIRTLAVFPGGRELERDLHRLFAGSRIRNEFFRDDAAIWAFLDRAKKQTIEAAIVEHGITTAIHFAPLTSNANSTLSECRSRRPATFLRLRAELETRRQARSLHLSRFDAG